MTCRVAFEDAEGTVHAVTVTAASLYEAVALAHRAFRAQPWTPPVPAAAPLTISVCQPAVEHQVTMQRVRQWAGGAATSPADRVRRERIRALLASS